MDAVLSTNAAEFVCYSVPFRRSCFPFKLRFTSLHKNFISAQFFPDLVILANDAT